MRGNVTYRHGLAITGATVRAFDKSLRDEALLAEGTTNEYGNFELWYSLEQLRKRNKPQADLIVRAYAPPAPGGPREAGEPLAESRIIFKAQTVEKLRLLVKGGPETLWSEYEQLMSELKPLLEGVSLAELSEDADRKDLTFLAGHTGVPPKKIAALVVAHKLAAKSGLASPEIFYGLVRKGMGTNLSALMAQGPETLRRVVENAATRRLIPGKLKLKPDEVQAQLHRAAVQQAASPGPEDERPGFGDLLATTLPNQEQREAFVSRYLEHKGPATEFWKALEADPALQPRIPELQLTLQLGALTDNHPPLVRALLRMRAAGAFKSFQDLASFDQKQWLKIIGGLKEPEAQRIPASIPGDDLRTRTLVYADTLRRILDDTLPEQTVAWRAREDKSLHEDVRAFFAHVTEDGTGFDLRQGDVTQALARTPTLMKSIKDPGLVKARVQGMQRVFKLTPRYDGMKSLLDAGLDSALAISQVDREAFAASFKGAFGTRALARHTHNVAGHVSASALHLLANHGEEFNRVEVAALASALPSGVPNLESLFGTLDLCRCEHCRSVYGPAAYYTEVLAFLKERRQTRTLPGGGTALTNARDLLFDRRPDLGDIELTCDNAQLTLPYVDLVNELLENAVSPPPTFTIAATLQADLDSRTLSNAVRAAFTQNGVTLGTSHLVVVAQAGSRWFVTDHTDLWPLQKDTTTGLLKVGPVAYQSSGSSAELSATPQHRNEAAYDRLRAAVFPWTLPLDLAWEEARLYLGHLGVRRDELMRRVRIPDPLAALTHLDIASELLGLLPVERQLLSRGRPVRLVVTTPLASLSGTQSVGAVVLAAGDIVLLTAQTVAAQNGLYTVATGAWTRDPARTAFVQILPPVAGLRVRWLMSPVGSAASQATAVDTWDVWGLKETGNTVSVFDPTSPTNPVVKSLGWLEALGQVRVVLDRAALEYEELISLLQLKFIQANLTLRIESADPSDLTTCDTAKLVLKGLTAEVVDRLHRFVRLWRRLGWSMRDLDNAIAIFSGGTADVNARLDDALFLKLSHVQRLNEQLGLPVESLLAFWAPMDIQGDASLYKRVFLNPALSKPSEPAFRLSGSELAIVTEAPAEALISKQAPVILAALGIGAAGLSALTAEVVADNKLNLANLSRLYRYTQLAKGLGLELPDLLTLLSLAVINPFNPAQTADTLLFASLVADVRASGFSIPELDYLLRHRFTQASGLAASDEEIAATLDTLRGDLRQIQDETTLRADPTGALPRSRLAQLQWPTEIIEEVVNTLNGQVLYEAPLAALPAGLQFPASLQGRATYDATGARLRVLGPLTQAERTDLQSASTDAAFRTAVGVLFALPRNVLAAKMKAFTLPTFSTALANLPAGLVFPRELGGRIYHDAPAGQLRFAGMMTNTERALLRGLSTNAAYLTAIDALFAAPASYTPPADNTFITSTDTALLFDTAQTPEQRFTLVLGKLLTYLRTALSTGRVIQRLAGALALEPRATAELLTRQLPSLSVAGQKAIADFLAPAYAESNANVALKPASFPNLFKTFIRLQKAALLVTRLKMTTQQITWFSDFGPTVVRRPVAWAHDAAVMAGWLQPDVLPVTPILTPSPVLFASWLRLVALCQLRDRLPRGEAALSALFALARRTTPVPTLDEFLQEVSTRTGWNRGELLVASPAVIPSFPNDSKDEVGLSRLEDFMKVLLQLEVPADRAREWSLPELTPDNARAVLNAVKARYSETEWPEVARKLRDVLRERQRAALVAYLVPRPNAALGQKWDGPNSLYAHYLIDVEMTPCFLTSRIKQASSTAQLFVQRCLMGLEADRGIIADQLTDAGWLQWQWMKSYRVWEANRKVFLYPENWLEPELRDDKTPLFEQLEGALLQGDLNSENADDAFLGYLEKLDEVARLEIVGVYPEPALEGLQPEILHVFGRTRGGTPVYFYRQRIGAGRWTHWERLEADISGAQIIPVVWNSRIHVFWPIISEVAEPANTSTTQPTAPTKYFEIQLAWTERRHDRWTTKKLTDDKVRSNLVPDARLTDGGRSRHTFRASLEGAGLRIWYEYENPELTRTIPTPPTYYGGPGGTITIHYALIKGFHFTGCNGRIDLFEKEVYGVFPPRGTRVDGMQFSSVTRSPLYLPRTPDGKNENVALGLMPGRYSLAYAYDDNSINGHGSFFFQDDVKTFFVTPEQVTQTAWAADATRVAPTVIDTVRTTYYEPRRLARPVDRAQRIDPVPVRKQKLVEKARARAEQRKRLPSGTPKEAREKQEAPATSGAIEKPRTKAPLRRREVTLVLDRGDRKRFTLASYIQDSRLFAKAIVAPLASVEVRYRFWTFYHPYVCNFISQLNWRGMDGLLRRKLQLQSAKIFKTRYAPTGLVNRGDAVKEDKYPVEDVDFTRLGAYSQYNWELFFHAPLLIASRLSQNQRFEDAQRWFHFIFDPTNTADTAVPQKYWRPRPFYEQTQADYAKQRIDNLLMLLAKGLSDPELDQQVSEWRSHPFDPHAIARLRLAAYQKSVVMKYLDNLIAWGDQLFRQDTIESLNEATQLYVLAAEILGRRPRSIPPRALPQVQTYNSLAPTLTSLSNKLVDLEQIVPAPRPDSVIVPPGAPPPLPKLLYFCVPANDKLLGYWDTVSDRLFKIRNCMNIEGVVRELPLFEPPIDPGLLVRAAAAGVDISSALSDLDTAQPHYRFTLLTQRATELAVELKSLGTALLSALEKRDGEELAIQRATQEATLLSLVEKTRQQQHAEATQALVALRASREIVIERWKYYQRMLGITSPVAPAEGAALPEQAPPDLATTSLEGTKLTLHEKQELDQLKVSHDKQGTAADWEFVGSLLATIPNVSLAVKPWGVGAGVSFGGSNLGAAMGAAANRYRSDSAASAYGGGRAARLAQFMMRESDWSLQSNLAAKELVHIDQQIAAALLREQITQSELDNHRKQLEHSRSIVDFMRSKYTNRELFDWTVGQVSSLYFQAYQLAYEMAKRTERAFRFELALQESNFIRFGYWDSLRKGLLSGERLFQDLKRMESAYLDQNRREYEISKHVSLAALHPEALVSLQETGSCFVQLPEAIFDVDHPGHYLRRLKSVSLTLPCVAGPYTSISCKLTLLGNRIRKETRTTPAHAWSGPDDTRFVYNSGGIQSVVTSSGREDSGLFELNPRDERYLPFEGAGAISSWRLELPNAFRQFDYRTLTDVVLHVRYTARDGGEPLKQAALAQLENALRQMELEEGSKGLYRLFSARHEFPDEWHGFLYPPDGQTGPQRLSLPVSRDLFPGSLQDRALKIDGLKLFLSLKPGTTYDNVNNVVLTLKPPGAAPSQPVEPGRGNARLGGLPYDSISFGTGVGVADGPAQTWTLDATTVPATLLMDVTTPGGTVKRINPDLVLDFALLCHYTF
ncbi:hypothetical protein D7X12_02040 [Corallococcus sicarius]|uniref:Virulence plasmid A protein n=1 Tax=Corallococcus sicarius TaxID=2316726 RepID=A0A3A8P2R8_9BACT|nr:hypothetical protein D7X12_02040 [Corallococcus sicarius]